MRKGLGLFEFWVLSMSSIFYLPLREHGVSLTLNTRKRFACICHPLTACHKMSLNSSSGAWSAFRAFKIRSLSFAR